MRLGKDLKLEYLVCPVLTRVDVLSVKVVDRTFMPSPVLCSIWTEQGVFWLVVTSAEYDNLPFWRIIDYFKN
jgi:hypothetical protein